MNIINNNPDTPDGTTGPPSDELRRHAVALMATSAEGMLNLQVAFGELSKGLDKTECNYAQVIMARRFARAMTEMHLTALLSKVVWATKPEDHEEDGSDCLKRMKAAFKLDILKAGFPGEGVDDLVARAFDSITKDLEDHVAQW
jgi:hypothetical protein